MSEFFHMGGHGTFIWTAYGISITALIVLGLRSHMREKQTAREAADLRKAIREQR